MAMACPAEASWAMRAAGGRTVLVPREHAYVADHALAEHLDLCLVLHVLDERDDRQHRTRTCATTMCETICETSRW
jgi:hypothetical protein